VGILIKTVMAGGGVAEVGLKSSNDYHKWEMSGGYSQARTQSTIGNEVVP
jgi:hypothetical protein